METPWKSRASHGETTESHEQWGLGVRRDQGAVQPAAQEMGRGSRTSPTASLRRSHAHRASVLLDGLLAGVPAVATPRVPGEGPEIHRPKQAAAAHGVTSGQPGTFK